MSTWAVLEQQPFRKASWDLAQHRGKPSPKTQFSKEIYKNIFFESWNYVCFIHKFTCFYFIPRCENNFIKYACLSKPKNFPITLTVRNKCIKWRIKLIFFSDYISLVTENSSFTISCLLCILLLFLNLLKAFISFL